MSQVFYVNAADPMPIYAQLARSIRFAVAIGQLQTGAQLPTVRQMAVDLRINANTVARVYAELERTGVVETRRGVGTFVKARQLEMQARRNNQKALRELVDRFITEGSALGFSVGDLLEQLDSRQRR
jgi:GntR family transcriptional regulator